MIRALVLVATILALSLLLSCAGQATPVPAPSPTPVPTPTSIPSEKSKNIIIDGVIDEWPPTAVIISDPSGDISSATTSKEGVDLKAVYALMDENNLYVAIQIYGTFAPQLLRNYFIALDFNKDLQDEYHFGVRSNGDTWVFDHTIDKNNWNLERTLGVAAAGEKDTIEVKIPREAYKIPRNILIFCRVTEGGPTVDSTKWFEVSQATAPTTTPAPAPSLAPAKEVELKYDDGTATDFLSAGPGCGYLVDFQAPGNPFTVKNVRMFGETGGDLSAQSFEVEIWDKDRKAVHHSNYSVTKFSAGPAWVEIDIPNVEVNGKFYVHVFTGTGRTGGIFMGADDSVSNQHTTITIREGGVTRESTTWGYRSDMWFSDKSKVNWMIRAVGTFMAPEK